MEHCWSHPDLFKVLNSPCSHSRGGTGVGHKSSDFLATNLKHMPLITAGCSDMACDPLSTRLCANMSSPCLSTTIRKIDEVMQKAKVRPHAADLFSITCIHIFHPVACQDDVTNITVVMDRLIIYDETGLQPNRIHSGSASMPALALMPSSFNPSPGKKANLSEWKCTVPLNGTDQVYEIIRMAVIRLKVLRINKPGLSARAYRMTQ